ncbi:MAG: cytochrome c biogenesis protein CcsA [Anaerolineae bacterium]|nr:MAG: heme exporter protein CcmC [Chloroflexi bacterium OLB13]MBW7879390.1 cytochrome c biogenesis protein CcsA [Anaerolineae bacterium]
MRAVRQSPVLQVEVARTPLPRRLLILTAVTAIAVVVGLILALFIVSPDADQGDVQRLFYIHMPSFFGAFVAFSAAVVGGIGYLRTRNVKWDTLALSGIEVGLAFSVVTLATGSIWARPIWNTWWTWDPRLTSAAIMALTYAAYLMLRGAIENPDQRRRFAAVYGIIAFVTVIYTLVIIRIRPDTIHPVVIGASPQNAEGTFEATVGTAVALVPNLIIWGVLLPWTLIWHRIRLQNLLERVARRRAERD